jgi:hypothetical protein
VGGGRGGEGGGGDGGGGGVGERKVPEDREEDFRWSDCQKCSKVRALLNLLNKLAIKCTFEKLHASSEISLLSSTLLKHCAAAHRFFFLFPLF